ncbi:MAG: hypothetical protein IMZ62_18730 [Chloroflexi bacterium]|nr:hypothetical protein [Chloroflexota bacterium]
MSVPSNPSLRAGRELNSANIWQRNYYEHIIRDQTDTDRIAGTILSTPLRGAYPANWKDDEENPRNAVRGGN